MKPQEFRLLSGEEALGDYSRSDSVHHLFCKHCGVHAFVRGHVPEIGGDYVSVKVNCLDGVEPAELVNGPMRFSNGRDNKWRETPAETRHL